MSNRDSFIFYRSFFEAAQPLESQDKLALFEAITTYALNQTITELTPIAKAMFTLIKPQLDANHKRYENGGKGGRPKTDTEPKDNQDETKSKANKNDNVNGNDNKNVNKNKKGNDIPSLILKENFIKRTNQKRKSGIYVDSDEIKEAEKYEKEIRNGLKTNEI